MVLEDGTSSMSSMFLASWESKYTVDLVSSETDIQMFSTTRETETAPTAERIVLNPIQFIEQEMDDVYEADTPFKDVFLPNYYNEATDSSVFFTMEEAPEMEETFSSKDIFKVWTLDIPNEEGEFGKQLALSEETSFTLPESSNGDSELLGNLVVGVANLSLNQHF